MTPKEKAIELVNKFMSIDFDSEKFDGFKMSTFYAQRCALIAVDETIKQFVECYNKWKELHPYMLDVQDSGRYKYWQEVKREIEKL